MVHPLAQQLYRRLRTICFQGGHVQIIHKNHTLLPKRRTIDTLQNSKFILLCMLSLDALPMQTRDNKLSLSKLLSAQINPSMLCAGNCGPCSCIGLLGIKCATSNKYIALGTCAKTDNASVRFVLVQRNRSATTCQHQPKHAVCWQPMILSIQRNRPGAIWQQHQLYLAPLVQLQVNDVLNLVGACLR